MNDGARNGPAAFPSGDAEQPHAGGGENAGPKHPECKRAWNRPKVRRMDIGQTETSPDNWLVNNEAVGYQIHS